MDRHRRCRSSVPTDIRRSTPTNLPHPADRGKSHVRDLRSRGRPEGASCRRSASGRREDNHTCMTKTALYRHYDQAGVLLYIGISLCALTRTQQHRRQAAWAYDIVTVKIEWFETRQEAEAAEYKAIKTEKPKHNQTFNRLSQAPSQPVSAIITDSGDVVHIQPIPPAPPKPTRPKLRLRPRQQA